MVSRLAYWYCPPPFPHPIIIPGGGVCTATTHNRSMLFVYKFIAPPYHYTYGSVHSMYRARYQPVGVTGIWVGGRIGIAPPRHCPVDTVEAATSSHTPADTVEATTSSDVAVPSRCSAASPNTKCLVYTSTRDSDASPIDQQLKRVKVTTRAGVINHTNDNTPVHRDPETDTDGDI